MIEFRYFIPVFSSFVCLLTFFRFGTILNPICIVALWWSFWLFVANLSLTGLFIPGIHTQVLILTMIFSMLCGGILAKRRAGFHGKNILRNNLQLHKKWRYLYFILGFLIPVVSYYFVKAIRLFFSEGILGYRDAVFGDVDRPSVLFGSNYLELLYALLFSPIIHVSLLASIVFYLCFQDRRFLAVSVVLVIMDAVMRLGRFNFYYFVFFLFISYLFIRQRSRVRDPIGNGFRAAIKNVRVTIGALALCMVLILSVLSVMRSENSDNIANLLKRFAVEYHTVGFVLFDESLENPTSRLNQEISYGRSLLGGIDTIAVILLRRIDRNLQSISNENSPLMREFQVVGWDYDGYPILYNAFYTILYSMYLDGRELFFFAIPFLYGYFLSTRYQDWIGTGEIGTLMVLNMLTYTGIFSIFQSPVEGTIFWVTLLLLFLFNRIRILRRIQPVEAL